MSSINGIEFNNISSLNGADWTSVTDINGIPVSHEISCTPLMFGYSNGEGKQTPAFACITYQEKYDFDIANQLLYVGGGCGITFAIAGFYSDGVTIFFWDGSSSFTPFARCN